MPESLSRVLLKFGNNARLAAAVGGAVTRLAERAGFNERIQVELSAAAVETCRAALLLLTSAEALLSVQIEIFRDRIEIALEHEGKPLRWEQSGPEIHGRVDSVESSVRGATQHLILIKFRTARLAPN